MSVLVLHPGLQHAHQLAWALHERSLLQGLWSGIPVKSDGSNIDRWLPSPLRQKLKYAAIPSYLCRHPSWFPALQRGTRWLPSALHPSDFAHRIDHLFDSWAARHLRKERPQAVVAYENAACNTFTVAKDLGVLCILDAASCHHAMGERLNPSIFTPYRAEILRRKDEEVALADFIVTCSPLAADSYLAAGVPSAKIFCAPLGAYLPSAIVRRTNHEAPAHFVFAGALRRLKAIDVICEAFCQLYRQGKRYRLTFVGGEAEGGWVDRVRKVPDAEYLPNLPQPQLFKLLGEADCLLLPSRYDSFGMVVVEAMATGTPAIVSCNTGAKLVIEAVPGSGWVITGEVDSLVRCVSERIEDREGLFSARRFAREAAQKFTWQAYRQRVGLAASKWLA